MTIAVLLQAKRLTVPPVVQMSKPVRGWFVFYRVFERIDEKVPPSSNVAIKTKNRRLMFIAEPPQQRPYANMSEGMRGNKQSVQTEHDR